MIYLYSIWFEIVSICNRYYISWLVDEKLANWRFGLLQIQNTCTALSFPDERSDDGGGWCVRPSDDSDATWLAVETCVHVPCRNVENRSKLQGLNQSHKFEQNDYRMTKSKAMHKRMKNESKTDREETLLTYTRCYSVWNWLNWHVVCLRFCATKYRRGSTRAPYGHAQFLAHTIAHAYYPPKYQTSLDGARSLCLSIR